MTSLPASVWLKQKNPVKGVKRRAPNEDIELQHQIEFYQWLRANHPELKYTSDLFGLAMHPKTRNKITIPNGKFYKGKKGIVEAREFILKSDDSIADCHIMHPVKGHLWIELKKPGEALRKKRQGDWASEHVSKQAKFLRERRIAGDHAVFAVGYEEAVWAVETWLNAPETLHQLSKHPVMR